MGQLKNTGLRSSSTTSACGAIWRMFLAALRPPQPPPQTTTRGALPLAMSASDGEPIKNGSGAPAAELEAVGAAQAVSKLADAPAAPARN